MCDEENTVLKANNPGMICDSHFYMVLSVRCKDKVHNLVCSGYTTVFLLKILGDTRNVEFCTHTYPDSLVYFIPLGYRYLFIKLL